MSSLYRTKFKADIAQKIVDNNANLSVTGQQLGTVMQSLFDWYNKIYQSKLISIEPNVGSWSKIVIVIIVRSLAQRLCKNTLLQLTFDAIFWSVDKFLHFFNQDLLVYPSYKSLPQEHHKKNAVSSKVTDHLQLLSLTWLIF